VIDWHEELRPLCAVCCLKIDEVAWTELPLEKRVRIEVKCHGESDVCEVDIALIQDLARGKAKLHPGRAFPVIAFDPKMREATP